MTTPDTADRLNSSSVVYEYTLKRLLRLIRPFSYCQPDKGSIVVDEDITMDLAVDVENENGDDIVDHDEKDPIDAALEDDMKEEEVEEEDLGVWDWSSQNAASIWNLTK